MLLSFIVVSTQHFFFFPEPLAHSAICAGAGAARNLLSPLNLLSALCPTLCNQLVLCGLAAHSTASFSEYHECVVLFHPD